MFFDTVGQKRRPRDSLSPKADVRSGCSLHGCTLAESIAESMLSYMSGKRHDFPRQQGVKKIIDVHSSFTHGETWGCSWKTVDVASNAHRLS